MKSLLQMLSLGQHKFTLLIMNLAMFTTLSMLSGCGILPEAKDPQATWSVNKYYTEAKDEMADGNYATAIKLLEKLETKFPYGRYAQQAQMELAYAYYKDNEPEQSLAACERFLKLHPDHPGVAYILYLKGLINFNDNVGLLTNLTKQDLTERDPKAARESFDAFKILVERFPKSTYAADAVDRMNYLVASLASHELHVARYYMKRGAYLAAANRAQYAIKHYSQTPSVEEALFISMRAYDKLGLKELHDTQTRLLKLNFPNSVFLGTDDEISKRYQEPWWKLL